MAENVDVTKLQYRTNILSNGSFWMINKKFTLRFGWDASILLSELITQEEFYYIKGWVNEAGYFFRTREKIKEETQLTYRAQNEATKILKKAGIIDCLRLGTPSKNYYKINREGLNKVIFGLYSEDN